MSAATRSAAVSRRPRSASRAASSASYLSRCSSRSNCLGADPSCRGGPPTSRPPSSTPSASRASPPSSAPPASPSRLELRRRARLALGVVAVAAPAGTYELKQRSAAVACACSMCSTVDASRSASGSKRTSRARHRLDGTPALVDGTDIPGMRLLAADDASLHASPGTFPQRRPLPVTTAAAAPRSRCSARELSMAFIRSSPRRRDARPATRGTPPPQRKARCMHSSSTTADSGRASAARQPVLDAAIRTCPG